MGETGIVHLVGAGCGDFDLITVRGVRLLERCDTVIYDSLIDKRLLRLAPENAEMISVGKRGGRPSEKQENINSMLVKKALEGKNVVRLKGGDPFVFGRGGEEILALKEYNIPYTIVPGITSAVAVPELAGIPVTHRKISRSFTVVTGHTADDLLPERMDSYAKLDGTLVFLMGLGNLENICTSLAKGGKSPATPAAVISNGACTGQKIVRGTLSDIVQKTVLEGLCTPCIIIVGETVNFDFICENKLPLSGVSVAVTGTEGFASKTEGILSQLGAGVSILDYLRIKEYENIPLFDLALEQLDLYKWIVFTSANGVKIFFKKLKERRFDVRKFSHLNFAAIGNGTAEALENAGIYPTVVPEKFTCEALAMALTKNVKPQERVLILRAEKGSDLLTEILDKNKILFTDIRIYDVLSIPEKFGDTEIGEDFLVFGSASGVQGFFESGYTLSSKTQIICIGEITAKKLKEYKISDCKICGSSSAEGIAKTILEAVK